MEDKKLNDVMLNIYNNDAVSVKTNTIENDDGSKSIELIISKKNNFNHNNEYFCVGSQNRKKDNSFDSMINNIDRKLAESFSKNTSELKKVFDSNKQRRF